MTSASLAYDGKRRIIESSRLTNLTHTSNNAVLANYIYQLHPTGRRTNAIEILMTEGTPTCSSVRIADPGAPPCE